MSGGRYGPTKAPDRACLKPAQWPEADRLIWQRALVAVDPLDPLADPGGERAGHSVVSNRKAEKGYGRYLTFLTTQGWLAASEAPSDRITKERVKSYVAALQGLDNSSQTILARLQELGEIAVVFDPTRNWSFIKRAASRIRAIARPARDKRIRLVESQELLDLGLALMQAPDAPETARQAAVRYRDGLAIALLALRPLRRRNFAGLTLGMNLVQRNDAWWLSIPGSGTKTGEPIDAAFPAALEPYLGVYLTAHRPYLAGLTGRWHKPAGDALWVSTDGSPMTEMALYDRIVQRTAERFGRPINPHLFRDAAATTLAIHDPDHVRVASKVLGHRSQLTTERHYQHAQSLQAHREFLRVRKAR